MAEMEPYRVEPAKSDRSTCTVSKEKIDKGEVRFGSLLLVSGKGSYKWRKLSCITKKQVDNVQEQLGGPEKVSGFAELTPAQQAEVISAFTAAASASASGKSKAKAVSTAGTPPPAKKPKTGKPSKAKPEDADMDASACETAPSCTSPPAKKAKTEKPLTAKPGSADDVTIGPKPVPVPVLTPDVIAAAHNLIDLAKHGNWEKLYEVLDKTREIVNVRPDVRDYGVLHQAAFHGAEMAAATLIDKYGADPALLTKHGKSVVEVAEEHGSVNVAKLVMQRLSGGSPAACAVGASSSTSLTPEKVSKDPPSAGFAASSTVSVPTLTAEVVKASHKLIDLAKEGEWDSVFEVLSKRKDIVNVRPEVREYGVLHQAVFYGDRVAVDKLIDKYGADPSLTTRSGMSAIDIADERGHEHISQSLTKRLSKPDNAEEDACPEEADDSGIELVKMPDGSWKVVQVEKKDATPGSATDGAAADSASSSTTPSTFASASASGEAPLPPPADPPPPLQSERAASEKKPSDGAAATKSEAAAVMIPADSHFAEAGTWHVYLGQGSAWQCTLKQGARLTCILQLLEDSTCSAYRVWSRWGPKGEGHDNVIPCSSAGDALAAFKSQFYEKTNNQWDNRKRFKAFFGKYSYDVKADDELQEAPQAAPFVMPLPEMTAKVVQEAHKLIDRAKSGRWDDLFKALDKQKELVNVRPDVREFSVLHQAAYYGKVDVITSLIDRYGADPLQRTKSGRSLLEIVKEGGHPEALKVIDALLAKSGFKL